MRKPQIGFVLVLLLLTACASSTPATTVPLPDEPLLPEYNAELEAFPLAPRYDIELDIDFESARVVGHQETSYTNAEDAPLDELYLRLFPATPAFGGSMTVTNLMVQDLPVTPLLELDGSAIRLLLAPPLDPGDEIALSMDFVTRARFGGGAGYSQFSHQNGVLALPDAYPLIPVYDDEGWNVEVAASYGDGVYSDVAFYSLRVTTAPTLTLIASGSCTNPAPGEWECTAAPVRDMTIVLGNNYQRASQVVQGVVVNSYYYSQHEEAGLEALRIAAAALETFTELFGPYPYAELDVVETPTSAGGIEYPGLVVIGEGLYELGIRLEWVVVHEVAHEWWYAVVGNDQVDDPWLDESLTQYSTLLYYEESQGSRVAENLLQQRFTESHTALRMQGDDMPVGLPVSAYPPDRYSPVVYNKGPLYFHALRERLGEDTFATVLREYYSRHRFDIATPESWLTTLQIVTGDQHQDLYEEWVLGTANQ